MRYFKDENKFYKDNSELVVKKDYSFIPITNDKTRQTVIFLSEKMEIADNGEIDRFFDNLKKQEQIAKELVTEFFADKVDKAGFPYIEHLKTVSKNTVLAKGKIIGLLHDAIEDTEITADDLEQIGFDKDIIEAVVLLTHEKDMPYEDYVNRIAENIYASDVKIADLMHNKDLSRLKTVTDYDLERVEKYENALKILNAHWGGYLNCGTYQMMEKRENAKRQ